MRRRRRKPYAESSAGDIHLDRIGDVEILERIGEGGRCVVHRGRWHDRDVVVKLHKAEAVERHIKKHDIELARYEYERNLAFFSAPGLSKYVAEPLAYVATGSISIFVQEWLDGPLYYFYYKNCHGNLPDGLFEGVSEIVKLSHAAGLFDVDLHAMNVIVVDVAGHAVPKLFDFNLIPFHEHPPNRLVALALRTGLIDARSRDLRKLRAFHDFRRVERRLTGYYADQDGQ